MKTDKQIYKIFRAAPKFFFDLTGIKVESEYRMTSESVKDIGRTMDGLMQPTDSSKTHYVIEFQLQPSKEILPRTFIEVALISSHNQDCVYNGIIIFADQSSERSLEPWTTICKIEGTGFQIFYLDNLLKGLERRESDHPLLALFAPLVEKEKEALAKKAPEYYNRIRKADLVPQQRTSFEAVLINWFMLRFIEKTPKQILDMLAIQESIEDSVAFQELVGVGEKRGKEIGEKRGKEIGEKRGKEIGKLQGELKTLKGLYAEGLIPENIFRERYKKSKLHLTGLLKKHEYSL